jgi:hypothetical protein
VPPSVSARNTKSASSQRATAWMNIEHKYATANLRRSPETRRTPRNFVSNAGQPSRFSQVGWSCCPV